MTDSLLKKCVENDIVGFKEELKEMFQSNFSEKMDKIKKEIYKAPLAEGCDDKKKLEEEEEELDDDKKKSDKDKKEQEPESDED